LHNNELLKKKLVSSVELEILVFTSFSRCWWLHWK